MAQIGDPPVPTLGGEVVPATAPITLFGTDDPVAVVERASTIATALADVIRAKSLYKRIGQSDHVFVEGWTLLGSMLGVFAEVEWSRPIEGGWESRAVSRTLAGRTVGAAESMCSRSESKWKSSDEYAIRSMAQTRAVSKALRLPLGFIMELAGYSATPAEEMPTTDKGRGTERATAPRGASAPLPGPSLDQIKARLLEVAAEHHLGAAALDMLIEDYVPKDATPEKVRAGLIELGTSIGRGKHDGGVAPEPSGAPTDGLPPLAENMSAEEAIAAGAALVGKNG